MECVAAQKVFGGFFITMIQDNFYPLYNYILAAKDLSDCDKIIFSILANLDRGKGCTMSNANIAKICGKSERTVIDSIGRLDKLGYITKQLTYTDKNNTLRVIKCTPIADICTPCEILHPMQESVDTPCENLHLPHAEICTPPLQDSAPKYKSNSIIDSIDNSIVEAHQISASNSATHTEKTKAEKKPIGRKHAAKIEKWEKQILADIEILEGANKIRLANFYKQVTTVLINPDKNEYLIDKLADKVEVLLTTKEFFEVFELCTRDGQFGETVESFANNKTKFISMGLALKKWIKTDTRNQEQRSYKKN